MFIEIECPKCKELNIVSDENESEVCEYCGCVYDYFEDEFGDLNIEEL